MSDPRGDCIVVSVTETQGGWTLEIDLAEGTATSRVSRAAPRGPQPIAATTLASLRELAAQVFASGDLEHREQFADGETEVRITLDGRTVTLRYVTAGASRLDRVEDLFQLARTCL